MAARQGESVCQYVHEPAQSSVHAETRKEESLTQSALLQKCCPRTGTVGTDTWIANRSMLHSQGFMCSVHESEHLSTYHAQYVDCANMSVDVWDSILFVNMD